MPNRRDFLLTLALAPCLLHCRSLWAANAAQAALVIGNAAYPHARLLNPTNDAKSIHALLEKAGFNADLQLDTHRTAMLDAIERFGMRVLSPETKLAVFYYAGHGAQLDWRNFLVPVNAAVSSAAALKADCIELSQILDYFAQAQRKGAEKTFVVILDACRDNPFGTGFILQNKGLSQFDAPVGSLLAYATAPGSVAADGVDDNGLYTQHLMKELSRRDVRIEDALKRVRLNYGLHQTENRFRGNPPRWKVMSSFFLIRPKCCQMKSWTIKSKRRHRTGVASNYHGARKTGSIICKNFQAATSARLPRRV